MSTLIYNLQMIDDTGSNEFSTFVEQILHNENSVRIDGRSITGKSTLINQLQTEMDKPRLVYDAPNHPLH